MIKTPPFGADVYFYFKTIKKKRKKIRIRISAMQEGGWYYLQRVRDGYISLTKDISGFIKE